MKIPAILEDTRPTTWPLFMVLARTEQATLVLDGSAKLAAGSPRCAQALGTCSRDMNSLMGHDI